MQSVVLPIRSSSTVAILSESLRAHASIILLVAGYGAGVLLLSAVMGHLDQAWPVLYFGYLASKTLVLLGIFGLARLLYVMVIVRPAKLVKHAWWDLTANPETHRQFAAGLPVVVLIPVFLAIYASFKVLIPEINAFGQDASLARWDRLIHGGMDPWLLLHPVLGNPIVTRAVDWLYGGWFAVLQLICLWQAFSLKRPRLRQQFFLSFLLVWILLGNVGATLLSSAGPCFYDRIVGDDNPYQPLMAYLQAVHLQHPLLARQLQDMLWQGFQSPEVSIVRGISAMPSIHVSIAFLMALLGWRVHRALGAILTLFLVIIMMGSVHLGWHYAIDGYAGIIGTYPIWRVVGWVLARRERTVVPSTQPAAEL